MRISDVQVQAAEKTVELSALIDGFRVWYRFPGDFTLKVRGDPFLAAALLPAMLKGEPIEIDDAAPVSPRLLQGIDEIQDVFRTWYPIFRKIHVRAQTAEAVSVNPGVGTFFSGGVDSSYTFLKHHQAISHLLFVKGIDMQVENDRLFAEALDANGRVALRYEKKLVPIATNVRFFGHCFKPINWIVHQGGGMASIALASGMPRIFIGSTHSYNHLGAWGSHVLTDRLWSTEATQLVHDGAEATRNDKLRTVAQNETLWSVLRVCWRDREFNCGRCEKCLGTRISLRALGLSAPTLLPLTSVEAVARWKIDNNHELANFKGCLEPLLKNSQDKALRRALVTCIRRYQIRRWLVKTDQQFFQGRLKRWLQLVRKTENRHATHPWDWRAAD